MSTLTTRIGKGSALSNAELDGNFNNLNADKAEKSSNLADLTDSAAARSNLGLGSAAVQAATAFDAAGTGVAMAIALG
jgi:hypothetical protein